MSINTCIITGHLTRDAEVRKTPNGKSVAVLGLAHNEWWGGQDRGVSFFDIEIWGRYGEVMADKLLKGTKATVHGRIRQQRWTTQSGQSRSKHVIVANNIETHRKTSDGDAAADPEPVDEPADTQVDEPADTDPPAKVDTDNAEVEQPAPKRRSPRRRAA